MTYIKKNILLTIIILTIWLIPFTAKANNCVWAPKCQDLKTETNTWSKADNGLCSSTTKPSDNHECCCGQDIMGCCEKTHKINRLVTTGMALAVDCHKMANDTYEVAFYQDQEAVANKCRDKVEKNTCEWKAFGWEGAQGNQKKICPEGQPTKDESRCGAKPIQGNQALIYANFLCCCTSNWDHVKEMPFIAPTLQVAIPGLNLSPTSSLGEKLLEDGSRSFSVPWIAEYITALYKYSMDIAKLMAGVAIMAGGLLWLVSGGEAGRINKAKELLGGSFIGLLILMCAYLIFSQINPNINVLKSLNFQTIKPAEIPSTVAKMGPVAIGEMKGGMHFAGIGKGFKLPRLISKNVYCPAADEQSTKEEYKNKIKEANIDEIRDELDKIADSFVKQDQKIGYEATAYNCVSNENFGAEGGNNFDRTPCDPKNYPTYKLKNLKTKLNRFDCGGWVGYVYACAGLGVPGGPTFDTVIQRGLTSSVHGSTWLGNFTTQNIKKVKRGDFFGTLGIHAMLKSKGDTWYDCGALNEETYAGCVRFHGQAPSEMNVKLVTFPLEGIIKATREKFYECPEC